ncbi:phage tail protein [Lonepinella sp. BR2930]|uniref:phage tail protein n=1 Tax=Lonepinella sp. BR2930 TaxID=3434554 RepID=UPI003F6DA913
MKTFNWKPQWGVKCTRKPDVKVLSFGNGYEQRIKNGINNDLRSFDVVFKGDVANISAIDNFLTEHGAVNAFYWTPYGETTQGKFKCEEWEKEYSTGFLTLTATFKEVLA